MAGEGGKRWLHLSTEGGASAHERGTPIHNWCIKVTAVLVVLGVKNAVLVPLREFSFKNFSDVASQRLMTVLSKTFKRGKVQ